MERSIPIQKTITNYLFAGKGLGTTGLSISHKAMGDIYYACISGYDMLGLRLYAFVVPGVLCKWCILHAFYVLLYLVYGAAVG